VAILTDADTAFLREKLAELLVRPVQLRLFTEPVSGLYVPGRQPCETCAETETLLQEVAALSDQIQLEVVDVSVHRDQAVRWQVAGVPTIAVGPAGTDAGVRFQGLPDGYEFTAFVETLASAGSEIGHGLAPETVEALAALPGEVDIKTFVTPT
jgi:alkyl hydroperoxide reductase subunit AhpF